MKKNILYIAALTLLFTLPSFSQVTTPSPLGEGRGGGLEGRGGGLSLDECISLALQNNRTLQNAALEIKAGKEQEKEMKAKYLPQISANVMAFHAFDKIIKGDGTYPQEIAALESFIPGISQMAGQPYSFAELNRGYSANISAMLPLYAGGQIHAANQLAKVGSEVAELQQILKEKDVVQKVTENYWQIVQLKYNLQTLDAAKKQLDAVEQQVTNLVDAGVTTRNALLQVRLRKQELASNRLKVENADKLLRMLLGQQIGPLPTSPTSTTLSIYSRGGVLEFDILVPESSLEDTIRMAAPFFASKALRDDGGRGDRPELLLASKSVDAQRLQVKLERGKCLPTIAVGVMGFHTGFGGFSDNVKSYMNTTMTNGIGLATVSVPISAWIGGSRAIRRAKIKLQQTQNDYQDIREQLDIDAESARLSVIEAYQQINIARASVEESKENLRMVIEQYNVGKITISDLLDAETLSRQSQNNLSSAIAAYQIKLADYKRKISN